MSGFYRKIGCWLGLLAILMATLAPTVSQTLVAYRSADAMSGEHCAMDSMASMHSMHMGSMPGMSSMHDDMAQDATHASSASDAPNTHNTPNDPTARHTQLSSGDACGYCSLLAHLPVMPGIETLFVAAVRTRQHVVATRFESVRRVEPLIFAQPRAPPFIA